MADEKLNTGPGEEKFPEAPAPVTVDEPQAPAPEQTAAPTPQQEGPAQPEPGDVVVSFDKINELMNEKRQTARAEVEKRGGGKRAGGENAGGTSCRWGWRTEKGPSGPSSKRGKSGACWQGGGEAPQGPPTQGG